MPKPKQHIWLCACLLGTFLCTCDAPHTNPLDPLNPNVEWARLAGTARSSTSEILADVMVRWQGTVSTTDENGQYDLEKIRPIDGMLYFSRSGYLDDSSRIEWDGRRAITHDLVLHATPTLFGRVESESYPRTRLDSVKVTWLPGQQYAFTDDNGNFIFKQPAASDGVLRFEKNGFRSQEKFISWPPEEPLIIALNANPYLIDFSLFTSVTNYYEPRPPTHELIARARLDDAEGDIAGVYIECPALDIKEYLSYNVLDKVFERTFSSRDLGLTDDVAMPEIVGYDFSLIVQEESGDSYTLTQNRVARVIEKVIETKSPTDNEDVKNDFFVTWKNPDPGFKFSYHVKIYTNDDFTPELVWQHDNVPAEVESLNVYLDVETAYAWEIWCVDEFNNRAASRRVSFNLKE